MREELAPQLGPADESCFAPHVSWALSFVRE